MAKAPALVLSSGGLHSLVAAGLAARDTRIALLHIADGRATAAQARAAFDKQVAHFKPLKTWVVDGAYLRAMSLPVESAAVVNSTCSDAQAALLPYRELQLLAVAAGFARQIRAGAIVWGAQFDPKATDALARNIETVQVFNQLLEVLGAGGGGGGSGEGALGVRTPLMGLEDGQVIELGYQIGVPFAASWSCQTPVEQPCMSCSACSRRIRAFRAAQLSDPGVVQKK